MDGSGSVGIADRRREARGGPNSQRLAIRRRVRVGLGVCRRGRYAVRRQLRRGAGGAGGGGEAAQGVGAEGEEDVAHALAPAGEGGAVLLEEEGEDPDRG